MSMEVRSKYEDSYLDKLQANQQKKTEEAAKNREKENKMESISIQNDEYISSENRAKKPSGLYHMERDDEGFPKVIYDDLTKKNVQSEEEPKKNAEKTTTNTDKVDREIKKLKEEKKQLEQQVKAAAGNEEKIRELEQKITQIENELSQKNNDTYRRQNAEIS
ncbi:MAG: hypothetical protein NC428_13100 [Clostridium sp.]|nr:hypothetical protein [Clostridium sp.]